MYRSHSELDRAVRELETKVSELAATLATIGSHVAVLIDVVQPYGTTTLTTPAASADHQGDEPAPASEPGKE